MRLLFCHNSYRYSSGEDIVNAQDRSILLKRGCEVDLFERSNTEAERFNLKQYLGGGMSLLYNRDSARIIGELVRQKEYDAAVVQNVFPLMSPSVYRALAACRIPVIQLIYNYRFICPNAVLYTKGRICERCVRGNYLHCMWNRCLHSEVALSFGYAMSLGLNRHVLRSLDTISAFVTPDNFLKQKLVEGGYPGERIFVVGNPFDVGEYTPSSVDEGFVLYLGRLVEEKGIMTLLSSMKRLPNIKLKIIGRGDAELVVKSRVREEGLENVEFLGALYDKELRDVFRRASCLVVPTQWYDNSPLVIHQAFALGKAVVASRIDGIPEVVEDGVTGLLVNPGDEHDLALKIEKVMQDGSLRVSLGEKAREKAEREFTADRRYDGLTRVINYAIQNPAY